MEERIADRHLPKDGLSELRQAISSKLKWAESFQTLMPYEKASIDSTIQKEFDELLFSALYVHLPQGRLSGIQSLKLSQLPSMMQKGYTMSTTFKTSAKFKLQPISLDNTVALLLNIYTSVFRPLRSNGCCDNPTDPLFIRPNGSQEIDIGRHVTRFFKRTLGIHITTTRIRSLMETTVNKLHQEGII